MKVVPQFSVFLINKPGVLAQVSRRIAQARINIVAMTMTDSSEHGVLRLVAEEPDRLRAALADVCSRLAEGHINISYA